MSPSPTLTDRDWLARWAETLIDPVASRIGHGSAGCGWVYGAPDYDADAAEMEAFVRPLWGLAPLIAGGRNSPHARKFARGIAAGTDPTHPEFWGKVGPSDQRMVEMAGIACAWLLAPETFWEPLPAEARDHAAAWMLQINDQPPSDNNWLFFRVLVNLALARLGRDWSRVAVEQALNRLDDFYLGEGWYRDGDKNQVDYYVPMAFHFYGLLFARLGDELFPEQAARFRARAHEFARTFQYWFSADGAAIPYGRSMTYRMAQSAFWAACAFAGEEVLPWPQLKGLLMRNLRWWADRPITDRDGVLSVGYAYPNPLMSEGYNGIGAPYWALKSFLVLALDADHPFWQAGEAPADTMPEGRLAIAPAGFLVQRRHGHAMLLTGGQDARQFRGCEAKYAGFAYAPAFGFSVPSDATAPERPEMVAMDSGLSVSRDGLAWLRRGRITHSGLRDGMAWGLWQPDDRLSIESWCDFAGDGWHIRLHRIQTADPLQMAESGFALDRTQVAASGQLTSGPMVRVTGTGACSGMIDLGGTRTARILVAAPNTNILHPRTVIPRLEGHIPVGETILATAVLGHTADAPALTRPAIPTDLAALAARLGADLQAGLAAPRADHPAIAAPGTGRGTGSPRYHPPSGAAPAPRARRSAASGRHPPPPPVHSVT